MDGEGLPRGMERAWLRRWWMALHYQGVAHFDLGKCRETPIGGPEFAHSVVKTEGGDARVMNSRALQPSGHGDLAQLLEVTGAFVQQIQLRRRKQ